MERAEAYNTLLDRVRRAGGYYMIEASNRPMIKTDSGKDILVAALFEGTDDSSPLKLITGSFHCWDVDDFVSTEDLERLCYRTESQNHYEGKSLGVLQVHKK